MIDHVYLNLCLVLKMTKEMHLFFCQISSYIGYKIMLVIKRKYINQRRDPYIESLP